MDGGRSKFGRICVFCGSSSGRKTSYGQAAAELGRELVKRKIDLVYGGGNVGLMGLIAKSVFEGGCDVIGVIPKALMPQEISGETVGEVKVVSDMHQRKAEMARHADAFIALPGGYGTLEEILEMITWSQLGIHAKPVGLLNVDGYYNPLLALFDKGTEEGFIKPTSRKIVISAANASDLLDQIEVKRHLVFALCNQMQAVLHFRRFELYRDIFRKIQWKKKSAIKCINGRSKTVENLEKVSIDKKFMFHTEHSLQVNVELRKISANYIVSIEAVLLRNSSFSCPLLLQWGLFRSDSTDWILLDSDACPPGTTFISGINEAMQTPLQQITPSRQRLQIQFEMEKTPFYIGFVLFQPPSNEHEAIWIKNLSGSNFCIPFGIRKGHADPPGVTLHDDGSANFALYSRNASKVALCLYGDADTQPTMEIDLDPSLHRTGDMWHVELESLKGFNRYGYRCKGDLNWDNGHRFHARHVLLDPYSKLVSPHLPGQEEFPSPAAMLGWLNQKTEFDWEDDFFPRIPMESLVAYRLHVGEFTEDASSDVRQEVRGTFLGLIDKISHLKSLGINAIILQPIFECDKFQGHYYPMSFFSPAEVYSPTKDSRSSSLALKEMVKSLHKHGIEVILDVVYTQTAEKGDAYPKTVSFRGIDNATYYILDNNGRFGAPNIFNCNHPGVHRVILDSLRFWVEEYHIDGFCFTNAVQLLRGPHGQKLTRPLLVEGIAFDPVLAETKLIADTCSMMNVGKEADFPHWKRWCECNLLFTNDVRQFLRGDKGKLSDFATRLCGSADLFIKGRAPNFSLNSISPINGFTLFDLVSYSDPGNQFSCNYGEEGPSTEKTVLETRVKQVRNFLLTLFLSQGVPVLNMGDEYGISKCGKVTPDSCNKFDWTKLHTDYAKEMCYIISSLSSFRARRKDLFQRNDFLDADKLKWHGVKPDEVPLWEDGDSCFLALSLQSTEAEKGDVYMAFNAHDDVVIHIILPQLPNEMRWTLFADSSFMYLHNKYVDVVHSDDMRSYDSYHVQPNTVVVFEALNT